jgi:hypothetical protein
MSKLQEKRLALKREHPAFQKIKFINYLFAVGHFYPPRSGSGSGLRIRIHSTVSSIIFFRWSVEPGMLRVYSGLPHQRKHQRKTITKLVRGTSPTE